MIVGASKADRAEIAVPRVADSCETNIRFERTMRPSIRTCFLIGVAAAMFHLSPWTIVLILAGYVVVEWLDQRLARGARRAAIDYEMEGWEPDGDDSEHENKGTLTRVRLSGSDQVIVTRLAG
jgi:hypothetical protein